MARLVEAGAGVTIVPRLAVPRELSHLVAGSVAHGTRRISVSRRRGTAGHPAVATVVHALKAVIRDRAPAPLP